MTTGTDSSERRPTRWETDTSEGHSEWYIERWRTMADEGADLFGEARLIDAMVGRGARILDAGCGPGRLAGWLHQQGHDVVGVDVDPKLIAAAEVDHAGPRYFTADLAHLDLATVGESAPFDAIVSAGNVLAFVAPDTEIDVLRRLADHLAADGFIATGFHVARLPLIDFDRHVSDAGLVIDQRFATWDLKRWHEGADFAVTILRHPQSS